MQFINNWSRAVTLAPGVTSLALDLPDGEYRLTLTDSQLTPTRWEIVGATVVAGTATLVRGLEGTMDQDWPTDSITYCAVTAGVLADFYQLLAEQSAMIEQKVDRVPGMGLSTEDFTTDEKAKLAGLRAGQGLQTGDLLLTARVPDGSYVEAGSLAAQADYPELFAIIGLIGGVGTPANGATWQNSSGGHAGSNPPLAGHHGRWIAASKPNSVYLSVDSATWNKISMAYATDSFDRIATDRNGTWIAVGFNGIIRASYDNGVTWVSRTSPLGTTRLGFVETDGNGVWIALATSGNYIRSADNGATWVQGSSGLAGTLQSVATNRNGTWLITGYSGTTARSTDNGATWTAAGTATNRSSNPKNCIATDGAGVWCISGTGGISRSTDDGATWIEVASNANALVTIDTDEDGVWLAAGQNGAVMRSLDNAVTWEAIAGFTGYINSVASDREGQWALNREITSPVAFSPLTIAYPYDSETQFMLPPFATPEGIKAYLKA